MFESQVSSLKSQVSSLESQVSGLQEQGLTFAVETPRLPYDAPPALKLSPKLRRGTWDNRNLKPET
jgi:hypothetical protein